jgi:ATP-dependent DNA helicase RecQ
MTTRTHALTNSGASEVPGLEALLSRHFGFAGFHPGQREPIDAVLGGEDAVVVMPTGAGKSICYQLPAMVLDGITLVVSPLISLMKDQVDGLMERGLPATCLNSSVSTEDTAARIGALRQGRTKLVYVAPERFRNTRFRELIGSLQVSLLAIDEAHCISQWGHDFRPDYLRMGEVVKALPRSRVIALTATATPEVQGDIVKQLGLGTGGRQAPRVFVRGFTRDNLRLVVHPAASHAEKFDRIRRILAEFPTGIIYCSTRKQVERVGQMLTSLELSPLIYHAGLPDDQRSRAQDRFMNGERPVVVATNAFGMGVDRSDLRCVIHWDIPGSVESYYQEVGRAGRDGQLSHCELLYNYADVGTQQFFLDGSNPEPKQILELWKEVHGLLAKGPQTCSLEAWSEQMTATDNRITVHTCMGLYERAGLIHRVVEAGNRCYTTSLAPDGDPAQLQALLPAIAEKRQRDLRKLDMMVSYVHAHKCRHRFILDYFGEKAPTTKAACGHCDYCGFSTVIPPRPPTETEWPVIQKLLSGVGRLDGRATRDTVLAVVRGSATQAVKTDRLDQISTYGALKDLPEFYLAGIFDELVRLGVVALGPTPRAAASLTPLGREVVWRRQSVALNWPVMETPSVRMAPPAKGTRRPGQRTRKGHAAVRKEAQAPDRVLSAAEDRVFDELKDWRREEASLNEVPGFAIFSNRTLKAIAMAKPDSLAALERIPGVGPAKLEAYGDAILSLLDRLQG